VDDLLRARSCIHLCEEPYEAVVIKEGLISPQEKAATARRYKIDAADPVLDHPSLYVAHEVFSEAASSGRHVLIFVHGYNNDMRDVIVTAHKLEALYKVKVVPFSWPANGGGPVSGAASYKSDKRDARVSTGAFDRFLEKLQNYHKLFVNAQKNELIAEAGERHPDNHQEARARYSRHQAAKCKVSINLLCHSIGCRSETDTYQATLRGLKARTLSTSSTRSTSVR